MNENTNSMTGKQNFRLKRYLDLSRKMGIEGSHAAVRCLHQRPLTRGSTARVRQFVRIDRGWLA